MSMPPKNSILCNSDGISSFCLGAYKTKTSLLQGGNKSIDRVGSEAIDVHGVLCSHHLPSPDVIYNSSLLRRKVDLVRRVWILAELLQHA